jgi:ceramide glucosyltransferase
MALDILQTILIILVVVYIIYIIFSHIVTWYYFSRYDRLYQSKMYTPPVSIIKPVKGLDELALHNFRSFCKQDYPNDYEVLFCVEDQDDPSIPIIKGIIKEYHDRKIRLVFSDPQDTRSFGKIKKMITGLAESRYEVIVFSNADVHVPPTFLKETVGCVNNPKIGLAFTATAYEGSEDWAAACWNISNAALVIRSTPMWLFGLLDVLDGKIMVIRKQLIAEIGGLEQFGFQADDGLSLGRAIRKRGYDLHLLKQPARILHLHDSFLGWCSHWHRWLVILRHYFPMASGSLSFIQLPLWWSLLYTVISLYQHERVSIGIALITAVLIVSLTSLVIINMKFVQDTKMWRFMWVIPILQLSLLPLLIHSYMTNEVVWRGRRLRVNADCTFTDLGAEIT